MISYRDMTFCTFYEDCKHAESCHRPLTPEVQARADLANLPIARFTNKPSCHKEVEPAPDFPPLDRIHHGQ